jgi:hypothetical protein
VTSGIGNLRQAIGKDASLCQAGGRGRRDKDGRKTIRRLALLRGESFVDEWVMFDAQN